MARKRKETKRSDDLSTRPAIRDELLEVFADVSRGFEDQWERTNKQLDYWNLFNCLPVDKQVYDGNAKLFVPLVQDAVNARKTRFVNQIFPQAGRCVEVTSSDGEIPHAIIALQEHYVRRAKLRTKVMPAMVKNGDIEGQYNIYVSWEDNSYRVTKRKETKPKISGYTVGEAAPIDDRESDEMYDAGPTVEVVPDSDVLVLPVTADTIDEAIQWGGSVTIIRRWTKARIKKAIADGEVNEDAGQTLLKSMTKVAADQAKKDAKKQHVDAAGIMYEPQLIAQVYETWCRLEVDGDDRLCRSFYGGEDNILGCTLTPYWYERVPLISHPVEKVSGVFKGISKVEPVASIQVYANDIINEAADSATYAMLPIIMTDPNQNPRINSMVIDLGAIWETSPEHTQFAKFPELWKDGLEIVGSLRGQVFQTLGVNPSMITSQMGKAKNNQAEVAQEQLVDILTTADAVTVIEQGVLNEMLTWFLWLDHQFRDDDIIVKAFGTMGLKAKMESVPPIQMENRYDFKWYGVEAARNAQNIQQMIAAMNVIRGIPPQLYPGRMMDLVPLIERLCEDAFGPRLAPLIFKDVRDLLSIETTVENQLLREGFDLAVNPTDNDQQHIQDHLTDMQADPDKDAHGTYRAHLVKHQQQMQQKMAAITQGAQPGGQGGQPQQGSGWPGAPGGQMQPPQPTPGMAGTPRIGMMPRPGAMPAGPNANPQAPTGSIPRDAMPRAGAVPMPRRM